MDTETVSPRKIEDLKAESPAFFHWARMNYKDHPIGALLLATSLYEMCRTVSDSIAWEIMNASGFKGWTADVWFQAAKKVLDIS